MAEELKMIDRIKEWLNKDKKNKYFLIIANMILLGVVNINSLLIVLIQIYDDAPIESGLWWSWLLTILMLLFWSCYIIISVMREKE